MSKTMTVKDWTDALRGGKYKQGKGSLRPTSKTFCCLGVLCDLADNSRWKRDSNIYGWYNSPEKLSFSRILLPPSIIVPESLAVNELIKMNDSGSDFEKIARYIEKNTKPDDLITLEDT